MQQRGFEIDLSRQFPRLPRAPIVEAMLQWQAAGSNQVSEAVLRESLVKSFPDYAIKQQRCFEANIAVSGQGLEMQNVSNRQGLRLEKREREKLHVVGQIQPDGVTFSQLAPYPRWEHFADEGLKFWNMYADIFEPSGIERVSVRFISQIPLSSMAEVTQFLQIDTEPLKELGVSSDSFFHQDTVKPGNLPYIIHVRRAVQPVQTSEIGEKTLIVDIDVWTTDGAIDQGQLPKKLVELRYLKNAVFFGLIKNPETHFRD